MHAMLDQVRSMWRGLNFSQHNLQVCILSWIMYHQGGGGDITLVSTTYRYACYNGSCIIKVGGGGITLVSTTYMYAYYNGSCIIKVGGGKGHYFILYLHLILYAIVAGISHDIFIDMCHVECKGIPHDHVVCVLTIWYTFLICGIFFFKTT